MRFNSYPRSDDYEQAWRRVKDLLERARARLEGLLIKQQAASNLHAAEVQTAEDVIRQAHEHIRRLEADNGTWLEVFVTDFKRPIDGLEVDLRGGYATLPLSAWQVLSLGDPTIIWSDSTAQALPGNYFEVINNGRDYDLKAVPVLAEDFANLQAVVDDSPTSHFEWERSVVAAKQLYWRTEPDGTRVATNEYRSVWDIIQPDTWQVVIPERSASPVPAVVEEGEFSGPLRLRLQIPVVSEGLANRLEIVPFQTNTKQPPARLDHVLASGERSRVLLSRAFNLTRSRTLSMSPARIDQLELTLTQPGQYQTRLAHHFYEELIAQHKQSSGALFGLIGGGHSVVREWRRITDPNQAIGVISVAPQSFTQRLGGFVDGLAGLAGGVASLTGALSLGAGLSQGGGLFSSLLSGLFGNSQRWTERESIRDGWDHFDGWRYALGIADVVLSQVTYKASGSTVLGPVTFRQAASHVNVQVIHQLPDDWGEGDWIQLELSADGETWNPILADTLVSFAGQQAYVRLTLNRPDDVPFASPLVHEVRLYAS